NERFEAQEQKILANKRKIEEERLKREQEIKETAGLNQSAKKTNPSPLTKPFEKAAKDADFAQYLRDTAQLTPIEVLNNSNIEELREQFTKSQEKDKSTGKAEAENKALYEKEKASRQTLENQRVQTLKITAERMDAQRRSETLRDNNAQTALNSILWYP
ncbi:12690_t:CDS:2, partial [Ambispora gerdemannii]